MTSKIAIIGGGYLGTLLAIELLKNNCNVTIFTAVREEKLKSGRILSSQCIWAPALEIEKNILGHYPWEEDYKGISGFHFRKINDCKTDNLDIDISEKLLSPGSSVDQRMKIPFFLEIFTKKGGNLIFKKIDSNLLNQIANQFDLVIVAAGKGTYIFDEHFPLDHERCIYSKPQRTGSVVYINGRKQKLSDSLNSTLEEWTVVKDIGDFFCIPSYSFDGPCHIVCMEGFPGSAVDIFEGIKDQEQILKLTKELFIEYLPWEHDRWNDVSLIDKKAAICGGFTPSVRNPVSQSYDSQNKSIIAFGDSHVLLDPLTAQGVNTHIKNIPFLVKSIINADRNFDYEWMRNTTENLYKKCSQIETIIDFYMNPSLKTEILFESVKSSPKFAKNWLNSHFNNPPDLEKFIS